MADSNFEKFKKRFKSGQIKELANPPPIPGPGGIGRAVAGKVAKEVVKRVGGKTAAKSADKAKKSDSGTFTSRVEKARTRERTPREKEQFGPLAKRPPSEVTKYSRPGGPVKKYERPGGPVTKYERQGGPVAKYERQGGALVRTPGKPDDARVVGLSNKAKIGLAGAAATGIGAGYLAGVTPEKGRSEVRKTFGGARPERPGSYPKANRQAAGTVTAPYEPKRGTAGTYTKSYDVKPSKSGSAPSVKTAAPKAASDKSRTTPKMTSFQRMKARQFEKEGVAGRSMTRAAAQKKAMEKVGGQKFSISMLKVTEKGSAPKATVKRLTSDFAKKNLAANRAIGKKS